MEKEELDRYKIRDYYMIPNEIIDNIFYEFETQLKKQKEIIDRLKELNLTISDSDYIYSQDEITSKNLELLSLLEDKEV